MIENAGGSTIKHIYITIVNKMLIGLPHSLSEQTAIANALNDVNALISRFEKLLAKKRSIKQGTMQKLLQPKRDWLSKKFNEVFNKIPTKSYQINSKDYRESGLYPVIDQGKRPIIGYSDESSKVFKCPSDGVIIFGDHTRIIKFANYNFIVGADGTQILSVNDKEYALFFYFLLLVKEIPNTGYNRHFKFLLEMEFIVPSFEEQVRIATILSDIDDEITALETKLEKYNQVKQGMMQNLLTGKIRLIKKEEPLPLSVEVLS